MASFGCSETQAKYFDQINLAFSITDNFYVHTKSLKIKQEINYHVFLYKNYIPTAAVVVADVLPTTLVVVYLKKPV